MDRDATTRRWFDTSSVKVSINDRVPDVFSPQELAELSGAFAGSEVHVSADGMAISMEVRHHVVRKMRRDIAYDPDLDSWYIYNNKIRLDPNYWGQHLAARSISIQARAAQALGFHRLSAYAMGNYDLASRSTREEVWNGYFVWPKLGFDGDVPEDVRAKLSPHLQKYETVLQLIQAPGGEKEWIRHGDDISVRFLLHPGSDSWQKLERYTEERGIRV